MMTIAIFAKIPIDGIKGNLKIKGLLIIYFSSFLIWVKDNSESLEKTMTRLDTNLDQAEKFRKLLS